MRTTLTLDDDVARALKQQAKVAAESFRDVVNDVLRRGLAAADAPKQRKKRFVVRPHKLGGYMPGIDPLKLNRLSDELETERFLRVTKTGRSTG
jgi:hypothetical protein